MGLHPSIDVVDILYCASSDSKGALALSYIVIFAHNVETPAIFHLLYEVMKLSFQTVAFFHINPYILLIEVTSK